MTVLVGPAIEPAADLQAALLFETAPRRAALKGGCRLIAGPTQSASAEGVV
jgi:hypothetical protein